jgi:cell division protein FtsB
MLDFIYFQFTIESYNQKYDGLVENNKRKREEIRNLKEKLIEVQKEYKDIQEYDYKGANVAIGYFREMKQGI